MNTSTCNKFKKWLLACFISSYFVGCKQDRTKYLVSITALGLDWTT